jgi:WD40 repeat protein
MRIRHRAFRFFLGFGLLAFLALYLMFWLEPSATFRGHDGEVHRVVSSADGMTLASVSPQDRTIRIHDVPTGRCQAILPGPGKYFSIVFRPDGQTLAVRTDETVKLWDATTGREKAVLRGHETPILALAFSPDGTTLTSGSQTRIILWDVETAKQRTVLDGIVPRALALAFSPDGQTLAWGGDQTVKLWDVSTGKERACFSLSREDYILRLAFSPDGTILAAATLRDPLVTLWDVSTGTERRLQRPRWIDEVDEPLLYSIAFSRDGKTLAADIEDRIGLWDIESGRNTAVFRPDHRRHSLPLIRALDRLGLSFIWDRDTVSSLFFTPDGVLRAAGMNGSTVRLWSVTSLLTGRRSDLATTATIR